MTKIALITGAGNSVQREVSAAKISKLPEPDQSRASATMRARGSQRVLLHRDSEGAGRTLAL
jgi:hypothetical protein